MSHPWESPVPNRLVEQAAHNNALWCEAVCSLHLGGGEFHRDFWLNRLDTPSLYPNMVTLTGSKGVSAQKKAIAESVSKQRRGGWSVKDCFQNLDLHDIGFSSLFEAEWLTADASRGGDRREFEDVRWTTVSAEPSLAAWEQAWRKANPAAGPALLFKPLLLSRADLRFMMATRHGACAGGGILNAGARVVGLTNLFAEGIDLRAVWTGMSRAARAAFPGRALVAYDRGESLALAQQVGFRTIGGLRVWRRGR